MTSATNPATIWQGQQVLIPVINSAGNIITEWQSVADGQVLFNLNLFNYVPNTGTLFVYVNGVIQQNVIDYTETSGSAVTFTSPLNFGDKVLFSGYAISSLNVFSQVFIAGGIGAVARTQQDKSREILSFLDYGIVPGIPTGTSAQIAAVGASNTIAINFLFAYAASIGASVYINPMTFYIDIGTIYIAVNGVGPVMVYGGGVTSRILSSSTAATTTMAYMQNTAGTVLKNFKLDANNSGRICIDTSWSISGPSVVNRYEMIFCVNFGILGWYAQNDNDSEWEQCEWAIQTTPGSVGLFVDAGGGSVKLNQCISAGCLLSINCQNAVVTGGYHCGFRYAMVGSPLNMIKFIGVQFFPAGAGLPTIASANTTTVGTGTKGMAFDTCLFLGNATSNQDNATYVFDGGLSGLLEFDNCFFIPPSSNGVNPNPLNRLFGPHYFDQAVGGSDVLIRGGILNSLDTQGYSAYSQTVEVVRQSVQISGVGRINEQQGRVKFRPTPITLGVTLSGTFYNLIPENTLEVGSMYAYTIKHQNISVDPLKIVASGIFAVQDTATSGTNSQTKALTPSSQSPYSLNSAGAISVRLREPSVTGYAPALDFAGNYASATGSIVSIVLTKLGNINNQY